MRGVSPRGARTAPGRFRSGAPCRARIFRVRILQFQR